MAVTFLTVSKSFRRPPTARRRGMSLIEMLLASAVMAMIATAIGALAMAVNTGSQYSRSRGEVVQHARVALDRIHAACLAAHGNEKFPGHLVVPEPVGSTLLPEALVVWRSSNPADPKGLPQYSELVIFTPDPAAPNRLLEVTAPGDSREVHAPEDLAAWRSELDSLLASSSTKKTQLTDLLRTAIAGSSESRGAVRFHVMVRPSDDELAAYRNGELPWSDLPWAQGVQGSQIGLRQAWTRVELQLAPRQENSAGDVTDESTLTFFGSAAIYYGIER